VKPLKKTDPAMIGGYTLIGVLGDGGMGKVYLSAKGSHSYAIKVLKPETVANSDARARLTREVEILKRIKHPNVVKFIDVDLNGNTPWIVMEFINGPNLKEWVEDRGVLEPEAWEYTARSLLSALSAVHDAGVTHRDVKPANVLMSSSGPIIIDFGIAYESDATSLTMTGVTAGSPGWMSPEQFDSGDVTSKSDVFSLGSTLYFAATGISPWGDESTSVSVSMRRILFEKPNLSKASENQRFLLEKMLVKSTQDRLSAKQALNVYEPNLMENIDSSGPSAVNRRHRKSKDTKLSLKHKETLPSLGLAELDQKRVEAKKTRTKLLIDTRPKNKKQDSKIDLKESKPKASKAKVDPGSKDEPKTRLTSLDKTEFIKIGENSSIGNKKSTKSWLVASGALVFTIMTVGVVAVADKLPSALAGLGFTTVNEPVTRPLFAGPDENMELDTTPQFTDSSAPPSPVVSTEAKESSKPKSSASLKVTATESSTVTEQKLEPGFVKYTIEQSDQCHHESAAIDLEKRDGNGNWIVVSGGASPVKQGSSQNCFGDFPVTPRVDIVLPVGSIVRWRVYSTGGGWEHLGWAGKLPDGSYADLRGGRLYERGVLVRTDGSGSNRGYD
jgi:serine/threonine protein kinase